MKGINFLPWKIKAIADSPPDKKWQTRRIIKPQPEYHGNEWWSHQGKGVTTSFRTGENTSEMVALARYLPDELVYIKETYCHFCNAYKGSESVAFVKYAEGSVVEHDFTGDPPRQKWWNTGKPTNYMQNPRTMPAWAARYFIRVTGVRAERLQEITEEDAIKEGCPLYVQRNEGEWDMINPSKFWYIALWDSINGAGSWAINPWVWVYSFVRCNKG